MPRVPGTTSRKNSVQKDVQISSRTLNGHVRIDASKLTKTNANTVNFGHL
jgi:hypothetical protein